MLKNRIIYLITMVVSVIFAITYAGRFSLIIMVTIFLLPLISFILLLITHLSTKMYVEIKDVKVQKEETFIIPIKLKNYSILCSAPIVIYCDMYDKGGAEPATKVITTSLYPLQKRTLELQTKFSFRGLYPLHITTLLSFDFLKLFSLKYHYPSQCNVTVFPKTVDFSADVPTAGAQNLETLQQMNGDMVASLRTYRQDDPLKFVHWKMSAKHDELIVKEFSKNSSTEMLVILSLNCFFSTDMLNFKSVDAVIETGLAITLAALQDSSSDSTVHVLYNNHNNIVSAKIKEKADYNALFASLSTVPVVRNKNLELNVQNDYASMAKICLIMPYIDNQTLTNIYSTAFNTLDNLYILAVSAAEELAVPEGKNVELIK